MTRCVAVLGQAAVGKSTLVNAIAGLEGEPLPPPGEPDMRCVPATYLGEDWMFLDCPGSTEFIQQSMDALLVADIAVVCVEANPEHAVLAAPFLRLVEACKIPHLIFVNKVDEASGRLAEVVSALQDYSKGPVVLRQVPIREGEEVVGSVDLVSERAWRYSESGPSKLIEIPESLLDREVEARDQLLEGLSDHDDWLLEQVIEDKELPNDAVFKICSRLLRDQVLVPVFFGSAAHSNGVFRLMKALRHEAPKPLAGVEEAEGGLLVSAFASRHRKHLGKLVFLRVLSGTLESGHKLGGRNVMLVEPFGEKPGSIAKAGTSDVVAAVKSDHLLRGRFYDAENDRDGPDWYQPPRPLYSRSISPKSERDEVRLSKAMAKLTEDDSALHFENVAENSQLVISGQGTLHLRRAREMLEEVFGVETEDGDIETSFRETITRTAEIHYRHKKQTGGAGQFADVRLTVEPQESGSGFEFAQTIHGGSVPTQFIPAVEHGVKEGLARGPLGFPVVDVKVTLTDGQYHSVDSSDMAFRIAGRSGVAEGLREAGPVLLEPIYEVVFHVPSIFTGALNPLISSRRGQVLGYDQDPDYAGWDRYRALLPGRVLVDLIADLRSVTQGVGRYEATFSRYQELYGHEADQVVAARQQQLGH